MFEKKIYLWNAVDVAGASDGLMRRGLVVDVKETGLIVDFAVAGKQPEFACYENVHFDEGDCLDGFGQLYDEMDAEEVPPGQADHEVLFRLSPDHPWIWYPALVLAGCSTTYLLVDIQIPAGDHIRRVFRHRRVYKLGMASIAVRMVRRSEFVKEDVDHEMPANIQYNEEFIARWKEKFPNTHPVGAIGDRFLYIRRSESLDKESPDMYCLSTDPFFTTRSWRTALKTSGLKRMRPQSPPGARKKLHKTTTTEDGHGDTSRAGDLHLNDLPPEIHTEILSFLDIQQEHLAGQVCQLWRSLLPARKRLSGFVINLEQLQKDDTDAWYKLAVVVLQRFQSDPNIHYVAITGQKEICGDEENMPLIETILMLKGILHTKAKLPVLCIANMTIENFMFVEIDSPCTLTDEFQSASCKRLILKNISMPCLFCPYGFRVRGVAPYDRTRISYGEIDMENPDLLSLFEKAADVHCFTDKTYKADLDLVTSWIRSADRNDADLGLLDDSDSVITALSFHRKSDKTAILMTLKRWQFDDIRFRPNFSWESVRAAKLDRNLLSLHKCAILALICCKKFRLNIKNDTDNIAGDAEDLVD